MIAITVTTRAGDKRQVMGSEGRSLMEAIRDGGVDEVLAVCGGCCSCATCHVYVDGEFAAAIPAMEPQEDDMLDCSEHRTALSRLSCQITCTAELDGLNVQVAPED
jgi:ferredoxin, 2Fe-2S